MPHRLIQILTDGDGREKMEALCEADNAVLDSWWEGSASRGVVVTLLCETASTQALTDTIQSKLGKNGFKRIIVEGTEAVLPIKESQSDDAKDNVGKRGESFAGISREELYATVSQGAKLTQTFVLLTVFSTIVAGIGLLEDNIAVVIGAMVIAPLLGPNLALALAAALGDRDLGVKALKSNFVGLAIAFGLSLILGIIWPGGHDSEELMARTHVGYDSIALAVASGAAGVLSLTAGVSAVLVGVMVAVALMPPIATVGIMLGVGHVPEAYGALLLLAVNIVCINLAAKTVFWVKGVRPRTWWEKKRADMARRWYFIFWGGALAIISVLIYIRQYTEIWSGL